MIEHPFADSRGFVCEHRLIAEKYLLNNNNAIIIDGKKYLSSSFVVHHIDFNRLNNNKENLMVMKANDHKTMHRKLYDKDYFLDYCNKFNLDPDITRQIRADFKICNYKKYI